MHVGNEIYYHIHKVQYGGQWKVGNVFLFDKEKYNKFFGFFNENTLVRTDIVLNRSDIILNEYTLLIRELVYEEIRLKYFPDLPSRQHCIWLCKRENLEIWLNELRGNPLEICKVKVTGNIHECYEGALDNTNINYMLLCEKAKKYWKGECIGNPEAKEYLLEGKVEVIEKISI